MQVGVKCFEVISTNCEHCLAISIILINGLGWLKGNINNLLMSQTFSLVIAGSHQTNVPKRLSDLKTRRVVKIQTHIELILIC